MSQTNTPTEREALTIEEMESLRFIRQGIAKFSGRNGNIKIDTASEVPLLIKAIDALARPTPVKAEAVDGWMMVPRDITMEMVKAGEEEYADPSPVSGPDGEDADWLSPIQAAWYAMLAAAPQAPAPTASNLQNLQTASAPRGEGTPGAKEAFKALDMADCIIERALGLDVPQEWHDAYRAVQTAVARGVATPTAKGGVVEALIDPEAIAEAIYGASPQEVREPLSNRLRALSWEEVQTKVPRRAAKARREAAAVAALQTTASTPGVTEELRPMSEAKKDRTEIIGYLRDDIYPTLRPGREDLESWNGRVIVMRHPGLASDGWDAGWSVVAPVGNGGLPDEWFKGWLPVPALAAPQEGE